jgi:hypothetical protein
LFPPVKVHAASLNRPGGDVTAYVEREAVFSGLLLAARHGLPAVYSFRLFVVAGGLMSSGKIFFQQHRPKAGITPPQQKTMDCKIIPIPAD